MLEVNIKNGALHKFYSIYFDGKNHIAWYIEETKQIKEAVEILTKG